MGEPLLGVEQAKPDHLNGKECWLFKRIRRIKSRQCLLKANTPLGKLMFLINVAAKL